MEHIPTVTAMASKYNINRTNFPSEFVKTMMSPKLQRYVCKHGVFSTDNSQQQQVIVCGHPRFEVSLTLVVSFETYQTLV